ncbi:MAG: AbgT family transporter [Fischerella sp.]|nr:AbgT family transporter [Fischerella sp.]
MSDPLSSPRSDKKSKGIAAILNWVEILGNRLPDPIILFFLLALITIGASAIAAQFNVAVVNPIDQKVVTAVSLLTPNGIRRIISEAVENFVNFPPLGTVLVAMLGVGMAEYSGLLKAALSKLVLITPARLISPVVIFAGIMSSITVDAGYVTLIPLAPMVFLTFKRHPLAGLTAAFAGVSGGFSANLLITPLDPFFSGFSQSAAQLIDPAYTVDSTANYYFMAVSTILLTLIGWYVTDKVVEPRLSTSYQAIADEQPTEALTARQNKGLRWAGYSLLALIICTLVLLLPPQGVLRDPKHFTIIPSPFIDGIVLFVALAFFVMGVVYGKVVGTINSDKDVAKGMTQAMSSMGYFIALSFVAAQFSAYFNWSNLGTILSVIGADFFKAIGVTNLPLLILFVLLTMLVNLFLATAAKWAIMASIFVPTFMLLGLSPEAAQVTFRIGDSITNIITPMMIYFPITVKFAQRYDKQLGAGNLIAMMLPYSLAFLVIWLFLLIIWYFLDLSLGPHAPIRI